MIETRKLADLTENELFLFFLLFLVPFLFFIPFLFFFSHRLFNLALSSIFDADNDETINDDDDDEITAEIAEIADDDDEILRARRRRNFRCDFDF